MERELLPDTEPTEAELHAELSSLLEETLSTKVLDNARCDRIREILEHLDALHRKKRAPIGHDVATFRAMGGTDSARADEIYLASPRDSTGMPVFTLITRPATFLAISNRLPAPGCV